MKFCFLKKNCDMDERQLFMRGNVFQHMCILYMALLFVNGCLKDCGVAWAPGMQENLIIFWLGAALGLCEYILRDITPRGGRNDILYILDGVFGGVLSAGVLLDVVARGRPIASGGMLTSGGGRLACGAMMLVVFFTYLGKRLYDRLHAGEEE